MLLIYQHSNDYLRWVFLVLSFKGLVLSVPLFESWKRPVLALKILSLYVCCAKCYGFIYFLFVRRVTNCINVQCGIFLYLNIFRVPVRM